MIKNVINETHSRSLLLGVMIFVISSPAFSASEKSSGMPQLDVTTFSSQIFWLIFTFAITYIILTLVITPKLSEILNIRKYKIENDLFEAKKAREEAEKNKSDQEKSLLEAKLNAQEMVKKVTESTKLSLAKSNEKSKQDLTNMLSSAEKNISKLKNDGLKNVSKIAAELSLDVSLKIAGLSTSKDKVDRAIANNIVNFKELVSKKGNS